MSVLNGELDEYGYPTEPTLQQIREWRPDGSDYAPLFEHVRQLWYPPDYCRVVGRTYEISTGGGSGNEDLISALQDNRLCWTMTWVSSRRGGHYVFELPGGER